MGIRPLRIIITALVWCVGGMLAVLADEALPDASRPALKSTSLELLSATSLAGQPVSFGDLLGSDGKAVCYTFLHPTCPLAQRYGPVRAEHLTAVDGPGVHSVGVVS